MYNLMEIKFLPFFVTPSCLSKINLPFPLTEIISLGFGWCPLDVTILSLTKTFPDSKRYNAASGCSKSCCNKAVKPNI